ncbi:MAG: hypothetical protein PHD43_02045 [Methylococcales bacterium]|nr:hypothetical protein [Methylococcales bacterium]
MEQEERLKYLKIALNVIGVFVHCRSPGNDDVDLAFRLGLDAAPTRVRTHDYGGLRYDGCVFDPGCKRPSN